MGFSVHASHFNTIASVCYHLWPRANKQQMHQLNPVPIYTSLTPILVARILWIDSGIKSLALKMFGVSFLHFARFHPIHSAPFTKDTCLHPNSCMLENKMRLCDDIETNSGPDHNNICKFIHWNLNSICTRVNIKISLLEAYNSIYQPDIIALSETMLNRAISNYEVTIEGFSSDILHSDHTNVARMGGACIFYRDGLPIRRRSEFELLQEIVVVEIYVLATKRFFS